MIGIITLLVTLALSKLDLKDREVLILGVQRKIGVYIGAPHGETQFEAGDTVTACGSDHDVATLCSRGEKRTL